MELLIILDALRRASAERITVVMPYYGYARQDKKVKPREPITARLVADMLTLAGASRILAVDLHADPWFADDLAGGYVVGGGFTLDSMGATTASCRAPGSTSAIAGSPPSWSTACSAIAPASIARSPHIRI